MDNPRATSGEILHTTDRSCDGRRDPSLRGAQGRKHRLSESAAESLASCPVGQPLRKRGRPRKSTNGEQPPGERRRTQIRLAQRAYRSRQETTMLALRERVSELESTVERISESFLWLSNELMTSGVLTMYPDLAQKLHKATERCLSSAKQTGTEEKGKLPAKQEEPQEIQLQTTVDAGGIAAGHMGLAIPIDGNSWSLGNHGQAAAAVNTGYAGVGNSVTADSSMGNPDPDNPGTGNSLQFTQAQPSGMRLEDSLRNPSIAFTPRFNMFLPDSLVSFPYPLPAMYSTPLPHYPAVPFGPYRFEEFTFAHRLQRSVVERGYLFLKTANVGPALFAKTFGFLINILTRDQITAFFEIRFRQGIWAADEWNIPFVSLGGAGTHYPRQFRTNEVTFPIRMVPEAAKQHIDPEDMRCEWFDVYDVQGYLEEKGLIPGDSLAFSNSMTPSFMMQSANTNTSGVVAGMDSFPQPVGRRRMVTVDESYLIESESSFVAMDWL
ncbi:hypothetical protein MPDQ_006066 [Monascus purpureus]|uniref:BZIP domain-containing protein n=1 Tax=Monascus purpureus TaxID=5098 RepID=A0A507QZM3_MONPU|nr:hypothetical protein MPDQ_006066 [Monascus purpureus]BDD55497.1 hypothetical protein MAP00_001008 [Monascus purpureus]